MLTDKQYKALKVLSEHPGLTARSFAVRYYDGPDHEYLFTAVSNQGNGACAGKKAWLCAGSLLGMLKKAGFVRKVLSRSHPVVFFLTDRGENAVLDYENRLR